MTESLASVIERFLTHRRALGRKYHSEEAELRLLERFAGECRVWRLDQLTPGLLDEFLASRPSCRVLQKDPPARPSGALIRRCSTGSPRSAPPDAARTQTSAASAR